MHRLVSRTVRDRLLAEDELNSHMHRTVESLSTLFVDEDRAWQERYASLEIVAHAAELWGHVVHAAERDPETRNHFSRYTALADWIVRHLVAHRRSHPCYHARHERT